MPTYQYSCTECGHFFEVVQSFSDDSLTVCPECEGRLRKVFNAVGVVFKGSGFYRTDSRAQAGGGESGSEKSEKSGAEKSGPEKKSPETAGAGTKTSGESSGSKTGGTKASGSSAPATASSGSAS